MPNLDRLRREGATGILRSEEPLLSPIVWTTIGTGRSPLEHGITGFLTVRDGKTEPVRSDERRVRAFWNVASDFGISVGVVGWYASWPAEPVEGFLISDRVGTHQVAGTSGGVSAGLVQPGTLLGEVESMRERVWGGIGPSSCARFFAADPGSPSAAYVPVETDRLETLVGVVRTTELYRTLLPSLMARFSPVLAAVYLEGTDSVGHLFAEYADPPPPWVDPAKARHLAPAFDRFYEYVDTIVGEWVSIVDPERTTVMIVSDHGFKSGDARPRVPTKTEQGDQAPLWHRLDGVVMLWGRGVRRGARFDPASIYDVLPTAFRLVGIPLARSLPGRPIEGALAPEILARPATTVEDYEAIGERERGEGQDDSAEEVLSKLRALGYVAGGPAPVEPSREGQAGVPLNRYNLGILLLNRGKTEAAIEVFRSLQRDEPEFSLAYLGEGLVYVRQDRLDEAVQVLGRAADLGRRFGTIQAALGEAFLKQGRTDDAEQALSKAIELGDRSGRTALLLGEALIAKRALERARPHLERARETSEAPADRAEAAVDLAVLDEERDDFARAAERYEEALREVPGFARALERYANLELYRGRRERARELLRRALAADPASERIRKLLVDLER